MMNLFYVFTKRVIVLVLFIYAVTSYAYGAGESVTVAPTPSYTIISNNIIHSQVESDNILYIVGEFTQLELRGAKANRTNIASFDLRTNQFTDWQPQVNGAVEAIAADEFTIYIGGAFTEIDGQPRNYIAAFNKTPTQLTPWNPPVSQPIRDIQLSEDGSAVYLSISKNPEKNKNLFIGAYNVQENTFTYYPTPIISIVSSPSAVLSGIPEDPNATVAGLMIDQKRLGFVIPNFSDILTFVIRGFFVITGLAALFYLLLGAFSWVTSGGDKDKINEARAKITSSVVGLLMVVVVLAVVVTLEQIVFRRTLCFGLSCPATIPALIRPI